MTLTVKEIVREMRALANTANLEGMARFRYRHFRGLRSDRPADPRYCPARRQEPTSCRTTLGDRYPSFQLPKDARILASLVGDPQTISRSTMDGWTRDFNSWDVCDACCCNLFDRSPHAWTKIAKWAGNRREYVRRAAFSTLAGIAVHDKNAEDRLFLDALVLIETYAFDDRNFVRKVVNWALRNIGKRNARLLSAAIACAERIRAQGSRPARWIAADALREFRLKLPMLKFGYQPLKPCKTSLRDRLPKSIPPSPNSSSRKRAGKTARSN